jgi:hypothetical protein
MLRGSLIRINITPLWVSGSVGLKHRPWWDVAVGTHVSLAPGTRVGNPSHHHWHRHVWGTYLNNIMTLPGGKHCLVRTLFIMWYSMDRYKEDKTSHQWRRPGKLPIPQQALSRQDRTGPHQHALSPHRATISCRLVQAALLAYTSMLLHKGRCHRQEKDRVKQPQTDLGTHYHGGPGEH